jgi:hypothetical protein
MDAVQSGQIDPYSAVAALEVRIAARPAANAMTEP